MPNAMWLIFTLIRSRLTANMTFHLYEDFTNEDGDSISDSPFTQGSMDCEYMNPSDISKKLSMPHEATSCFHMPGAIHHWEGFKDLMSELQSAVYF